MGPRIRRPIPSQSDFNNDHHRGESRVTHASEADRITGRESFHVPFSEPRGFIVNSSPKCFAILITHSSLPKDHVFAAH
jgi:hypothetical protein